MSLTRFELTRVIPRDELPCGTAVSSCNSGIWMLSSRLDRILTLPIVELGHLLPGLVTPLVQDAGATTQTRSSSKEEEVADAAATIEAALSCTEERLWSRCSVVLSANLIVARNGCIRD